MDKSELQQTLKSFAAKNKPALHKVELCNVAYMNAILEAALKASTEEQRQAAKRHGDNKGVIPYKGLELKGVSLAGLDLEGIDLSGADLSDADLNGANLRGANLSFCNFSKVNLIGADVSGANLSYSNFGDVAFSEGKKETCTKLAGTILIGTFLWRAALTECDLSNIIVMDADFRNAQLSRADCHGSWLRRNIFVKACLFQANLSGAHAFSIDFQGADLREANLDKADLRGSTLTGANLEKASLKGANLEDAIMTSVNISSADMTGANLKNTTYGM